jgi:hypothetical protein
LRAPFALLAVFLLFLVLPLFAGTDIVHRWVLTGLPMPKFTKVMVASVMENYLVRQSFEDEMKKLLEKNGVQAVQSYMVLPPKNEMMEGELRQRIKESVLDGVIVVRPKAVRQETEEVVTGGVWVPPPGYYSFYPYWNMAYGQFYATSWRVDENVIVRVEVNFYNVKDEKLVWSGETDTVYSKDFEKLGKDYAKTLVKQLKRDKVIGQK